MPEFPYGYCGMPCALCSRYHTQGSSRCPGCSANGYYTESCKVHHCCQARGLLHCGACPELPCARLGRMADFSDLNTGHAKQRSCAAVASEGFAAWYEDYAQRAALLQTALANYNDGRMKRYLCELFLQHDLAFLRELMHSAAPIEGTPKEKGRAFREVAEGMKRGAQAEGK